MATQTEIAEALDQLDAFAAKHKGAWKDAIAFTYWMRGIPVPGYPLIYLLRTAPGYGPSWLDKYKPGTR